MPWIVINCTILIANFAWCATSNHKNATTDNDDLFDHIVACIVISANKYDSPRPLIVCNKHLYVLETQVIVDSISNFDL